MNPQLLTNWSDHDHSLQKILLLATRTLRIFDEDLTRLGLENTENAFFLRRFLTSERRNTLTIVVRNADPLRRNSPRLLKLLNDFPNSVTIHEGPPQVAALNDAMVLADNAHALVRFHKDQVRSKVLIDNTDECRPYLLRFEEILKEGGTPISATTLGL